MSAPGRSEIYVISLAKGFPAHLLHVEKLMQLIHALWAEVLLCVAVTGLTVRTLLQKRRGGRLIAGYSLCMASMMFFDAIVTFPISWTPSVLPVVYDPVLYRMSAMIHAAGVAPVAAFADSSPVFKAILGFTYISLTHLVALGFSSEIAYRDVELKRSLFARFVLLGFIGYGLYFLMPAVSPGVYFGADFPNNMPKAAAVAGHAVVLSSGLLWATRNTMPSLHAAWAILCFLALWKSPVWHRVFGLVFVVFTFLATIGFGYHYVVDWVAAFPLALLVRGLTVDLPARGPRAAAVGGGVVLLALWVAAVRMAPLTLRFPNLIEGLAALSILVPIFLEVVLRRLEDPAGIPLRLREADCSEQAA